MNVTEWLRGLGLEQYAAAFRENEIGERVLPRLTVDDLKDLGVTLVGHRRLLLDAIAALREAGPPPAAADPPAAPAEPPARSAGGERRQVTVMFCDMIDSTALSARLDPEDLSPVIRAYQSQVAATIARFDGYIARYVGDGVLIYFGYPRAQEDDAERAVRAALAVIADIGQAPALRSQAIRVRIGLATGLVVVGEPIGIGDARQQTAIGETPNLAARLQARAEPDTVVIAESTRRLIGDLFEYRDLGAIAMKGIAGPVPAWRVLRPSAVESRFEAMHAATLSPLVGRDEESHMLRRRWTRAGVGEGQVVLVLGEPGIGKSRLTAALCEDIATEPQTRLRYFCAPQRADSALHPFIGQIERAAGWAYTDTPRAKLDKLDAILARTATSAEDAAVIAGLLSLPNDGRYPAVDMDPEQRRRRVLQALLSQLTELARQSPVLMIFEDAHWVDPTSLELLGRVVALIKALPALLVVTFRPEFAAPWVGQSHVTSISLNRLAERETEAIIARLAGNRDVPADVMAEIVARTDGIPLFVEEMTKAVLEAENEGAARRTVAAVPAPFRAVPASLHASLMARLDRLGPAAGEVAQVGAAIGREFSHALLAAVAREPEAELESALDRLVQAGLLFRHGVAPHASYLFKHALVQDAAYGTLLRERRRALHARIAETLESQFAETAESRPEVLAHHCTEAGLIEKAAHLWGEAGQRSLERSALVEAATQLSRALEQIATLPGTAALRREQIRLQVAFITPLIHTKGFAGAETKAAVEQARLLIEQAEARGEPPDDPLLLFQVLHGFWLANQVAFNGDVICDLAARFLALAEKRRAKLPLVVGHRIQGASLMLTGDLVEGREHFDETIKLYEPAELRPFAARFGMDSRVACLYNRSSCLWVLGYPEAALKDADDAIEYARDLGYAGALMGALKHAIAYILSGNYPRAAAHAQELISLAEEKSAQFWEAEGRGNQGILLALAGRASDATETLISAITASRSTGATYWTPFRLPYLALAHAELGQFWEAWRYIDEAISLVEKSNERWSEADIHRMAGDIALMGSRPDASKAEACFERAIAIARAQQAKSWELRATTSLARLWQGQGRRRAARDRLAPIHGWFTEGFDTLDLKEAKALLDALHA